MSESTTATAPKAGTPNLNKALSQLQGDMPKVKKTKTGKIEGENKAGKYFSYEYSYADLGDVVADMGPLLAKHGLAFHCAPTINPADRREMVLQWFLLHESGEERSGEWPLGPASQKPQSLGSAITYGRRYSFTAATNIVLEDDDDGQRAQQQHDRGRQSAGDVWESATPAPARQNRGEGNGQRSQAARSAPEAPAGQAQDETPLHAASWVDTAIEQAAAVASEPEAGKLWTEAASRAKAREITEADAVRVQAALAGRVDALRTAEMGKLLALLSEDDEWRSKVEELADEESARAALLELGGLVTAKKIDMTRANRISRAIIARWPKARTATEGERAA
jgi:hypothetical protein